MTEVNKIAKIDFIAAKWHEYANEIAQRKEEIKAFEVLQEALFRQLPSLWYVRGSGYHGTRSGVLFVAKTKEECIAHIENALGYSITNSSNQFIPKGLTWTQYVAGSYENVTPINKVWHDVFTFYTANGGILE